MNRLGRWWLIAGLAVSGFGCGAGTTGEADWPEEEPSCGGTGEEALAAQTSAGCAWPRGGCELAPLGAGETSGRAGMVRLTASETRALGATWDGWVAGAPAEALALARDEHGGLRVLASCHLGVAMRPVPAASPDTPPAWSAAALLVTAPVSSSTVCDGATHFVALARGDEGVALPLTCPPLSFTGAPRSCVGAGLDGDAREAWGRALYGAANAAYLRGDHPQALDGFLTLRALMPDSLPVHFDLAETSARLPEPSCAYRDAVSLVRSQLPDDGSVARPWPSARCIPAPPLLGCLSGFASPPSLDHC